MTKSNRFLKWTLLACVTASMASACVVTTGDGDDDFDFDDGGEGGSSSNNTAGTKAATGGGGSTSKAGTGGGGTSGTTGGGGAATTAGTGGTGGSAPAYMAGLCDSDAPDQESGPTPSEPADGTLNEADEEPGNACRKCLKTECTDEWTTCYGQEPTIACGFGPTATDNDGQFDCFLKCFAKAAEDQTGTADEAILDCSFECTNQCDDGGVVMVHTNDLVTCANESCQASCLDFTPPE